MSEVDPFAIDPAFARTLDRFDVPSPTAGFLERIAQASSSAQTVPGASAIWMRRRTRDTWRRGTLVGIVAIGLASAAAAASGVFGSISFKVPPIAALFSPAPKPTPVLHAKPKIPKLSRPTPERPSAVVPEPVSAGGTLPLTALPKISERQERQEIARPMPTTPARIATAPVLRTLHELVRQRKLEAPILVSPERSQRGTLPIAQRQLARGNAEGVANRRIIELRPQLVLPSMPEIPGDAMPQSVSPLGVPDAKVDRPDTLKALRQAMDLRDLRSKRQALRRLRKH